MTSHHSPSLSEDEWFARFPMTPNRLLCLPSATMAEGNAGPPDGKYILSMRNFTLPDLSEDQRRALKHPSVGGTEGQTGDNVESIDESPYPSLHKYSFLPLRKKRTKNAARSVSWYESSGKDPLQRPQGVDPASIHELGDVYMHKLSQDDSGRRLQLWVWKVKQETGEPCWHRVTLLSEERHPKAENLVLSVNNLSEPTWVAPDTARRHRKNVDVVYLD
ncbi:hypothetical protein NM688_g476 [Phlebia brevispora]|uniref:Uncharacterized protein n=1 Tax=Phlebia brevispora TaxID=194682 RepID=A0ACC1TEJ3_9APHY|nr:hypothetical protein NM688_g476 [Phlebia brevispora]